MSAATPFSFAALLPAGLPAPAARWTGLAKYSFVGGNNDPDQVPVDGLVDAIGTVLRREGRTLATYGLASGPQGCRPPLRAGPALPNTVLSAATTIPSNCRSTT